MLKNLRIAVVSVTVLLSSVAASAGVTPLAVSIFPPVQFPPHDFTVAGARVSVFMSKHRNMYGIDLGVVGNTTEQAFAGLAVAGGFNYNGGTATVVGFQLAGLANVNVNHTRVVGIQAAGFLNSNRAESSLIGFQVALANYSPHTKIGGIQAGLYNSARDVYGLQIGIVNSAQALHGVQIGLVNFNHAGPFSIAPILNVGF